MDIRQVPIKEIKPYAKNAKKHDATQIENVKKSIEKFGIVQPLVIDKDKILVIGHCRFEACKKLGYKELPCVQVDKLTDEEVAMLRLLDNKLNESEWDVDLLAEELDNLDFGEFDVDFGIKFDEDYGTDFELPSGDKSNIQQMTFTLTNSQAELVNDLIGKIQKTDEFKQYNESESENANKNGNALYLLLAKVELDE